MKINALNLFALPKTQNTQNAPQTKGTAKMTSPLAADTVSFGSMSVPREGNGPEDAATLALKFYEDRGWLFPGKRLRDHLDDFVSPRNDYLPLGSSYGAAPEYRENVTSRKIENTLVANEYMLRVLSGLERDAKKVAAMKLGIRLTEKIAPRDVLESIGIASQAGEVLNPTSLARLEENYHNPSAGRIIERILREAKNQEGYEEAYEEAVNEVSEDINNLGFYLREPAIYPLDKIVRDYHGFFKPLFTDAGRKLTMQDDTDEDYEAERKDRYRKVLEGLKRGIIKNFDEPDPNSGKSFYLYRDFANKGWDAYFVDKAGRYEDNPNVRKLDGKFLNADYEAILAGSIGRGQDAQKKMILEDRETTRFNMALKKAYIQQLGIPQEEYPYLDLTLPGNCILEPVKRHAFFQASKDDYRDYYDYFYDYRTHHLED